MQDVKICGITSEDDARLCHAAGADLLGVILTASARQIDPLQAAAIAAAVPEARLVGVVRDGPIATLALQLRVACVHAVQLHGIDDPRRWVAVADATGLPVVPAVTADRADTAFAAVRKLPGLPLAGVLLDLPKTPAAGRRDHGPLWDAARRGLAAGLPILLAGSLTAGDLPHVRREVGPCGLDVCRGTERAAGVKDPRLVREFVAAAHDPEVRRVS